MVQPSLTVLIVVDCCVVTTSKEMDDTCMLASILAESIPIRDDG